jgi:hypothetical protein
MNIFVYDTAAGRTKNWASLLGRPFEYVNLTLTDKKASCTAPKGVQADLTSSLILLHGPRNRMDAAVVIAATLTQECRACSAVVVSGGGLTEDAQIERVYLRRTPVDKEDVGFRGCFEAFISDLEKSQGRTPHFDLLEPTAVPNPMVAYAVAVQYRLQIPNIQELSAAADACYDQIQPYAESLLSKPERGPISSPEVLVPSRAVFESETPGDPNGTRFKAMRNAIELLREDL